MFSTASACRLCAGWAAARRRRTARPAFRRRLQSGADLPWSTSRPACPGHRTAPPIVEAVADLVADGGADGAVVGRRRPRRIEKGGARMAAGKFSAFCSGRLMALTVCGDIAHSVTSTGWPSLPGSAGTQSARRDRHCRGHRRGRWTAAVVDEALGIADANVERRELFFRLGLGGRRHPRQFVDALSAKAARMLRTISCTMALACGEKCFFTYSLPTASPSALLVSATLRFQRSAICGVPARALPWKAKCASTKVLDKGERGDRWHGRSASLAR